MRAIEKSILITGCSSGIGYATAHYLRDRNYRVFASCRKAEDCERLKAEGFEAPRLDYEDPASIAACAQEVLTATGGRLGALFNNGAYAVPGLVEDLPVEALQTIFQANFFGWHDLTRRLIPTFRAQGAGRILQCSSVLGFVGATWRGAYVSTKYAVEGLTDVLRLEMRGTGIAVILIEPGPVTSLIRQNAVPHFERWFRPEASARAADYDKLRARLYGPRTRDTFELPPEAVAAKVLKALESSSPRPRYYVTTPTYIAGALRRFLSTRALDSVLARN